jgi:serine-type D-Ala-D-Ala carboxypeptidase (penicillin-binding protein 5/6)
MGSALFFVVLLTFPFLGNASPDEITAESYLLVEKDTFSIIAGKDIHRPLPPASTTKVMTAVLALEKMKEEESIIPTKRVLSIPASKLSLCPGQPYRAIDLINGAMVESANDAAYSLAVAIAGSEPLFADMMNAKAREIGAFDTHFVNASGLHEPGHYSSAYDLALIFRYALDNPRFQEVVGTRYFLFKNGRTDIKYVNHNRLLHCFAPNIGGKTGFTRVAKHTYVGAFEKEGKVYILSMLGSRTMWGDVVKILEEIFTDLPTKQEIALAKANPIVLSSYGVKQASYTVKVKKEKKKYGKKKHGKVKVRKGRHRT